ncbi:signal peptidase II [Cellulomonas endophytica]|uniref:signal peptidase II n=1 Tax=Cellulomonas endophytica TaxID=2494735 RepID=UPI0010123F4E|nr:signal peptidase II [Cellulomonas endophytica]
MTGTGENSRTVPVPTTAGRRRAALFAVAALVAVVDLWAKAWAQEALPAGAISMGMVDLQLAYNPGVAFSVGADAPRWLVIAATTALTAAVAVFAWRSAARAGRMQRTALGLVLGGAVANLLDRAADGVVTDYLHSGWWPTFNLADTAIVCGAVLLVAASWRHRPDDAAGRTGPDSAGLPANARPEEEAQ